MCICSVCIYKYVYVCVYMSKQCCLGKGNSVSRIRNGLLSVNALSVIVSFIIKIFKYIVYFISIFFSFICLSEICVM